MIAAVKICTKCGIVITDATKVPGERICKDCLRKWYHSYYEMHREQMKASAKRWREQHPEQNKANKQNWRENNHEQANGNLRRWRKNNPESAKLHNKIFKYRRRNAEGSFTLEEWNAKLEEFNYCCAYCGCGLDNDTITIDHKIPLSKGGSNYISNLVPSCRSCNSQKYNKLLTKGFKVSGVYK